MYIRNDSLVLIVTSLTIKIHPEEFRAYRPNVGARDADPDTVGSNDFLPDPMIFHRMRIWTKCQGTSDF